MKVYLHGVRPRHALIVAPGVEHPNSDFLDAAGKPKQIRVDFTLGQADVPDALGRYMVDQGLAKSSPLILPPGQ